MWQSTEPFIFKRELWEVRAIEIRDAKPFIEAHHYAKGASKTAVFIDSLYRRAEADLQGVAWWLPPTRVAAESVEPEHWKRVLSLSRMAVAPGVPKNACSFLLGRAVRRIKRDGRFITLLTFADESQGHAGGVYRACGWEYLGRTGPYLRWVDPRSGRQVASQATRTRTHAEMESLGYVRDGKHCKHKFVLRLSQRLR